MAYNQQQTRVGRIVLGRVESVCFSYSFSWADGSASIQHLALLIALRIGGEGTLSALHWAWVSLLAALLVEGKG